MYSITYVYTQNIMPLSPFTVSDITNVSFHITIPPTEDDPEPCEFVIPNMSDDDIDEAMYLLVR